MAMLAEPRKNKSYLLQPRGKPLFEDESSFGSRMLAKMGWSKGKGLGPNENGKTDFVKVSYKNDSCGMGYDEKDDQWTQHESDFNTLLQNLSGQAETGTAADTMPGVNRSAAISGESLEEKSKQSKSRVHYRKFTRGKDLTQYSAKDLANIFGKKTLDEDTPAKTGFDQNYLSYGVQTVQATSNMAEYFNKKITKCEGGLDAEHTEKKAKKRKNSEIKENMEEIPIDAATQKKSKKQKTTATSAPEIAKKPKLDVELPKEVQPVEDEKSTYRKKRCKKSKENTELTDEAKPKKLKKVKTEEDACVKPNTASTTNATTSNAQSLNTELTEEVIPKKLKKKKTEDTLVDTSTANTDTSITTPVDDVQSNVDTGVDEAEKTIVKISAYAAERFAYLNLEAFRNSSLQTIVGYGINKNMEFEVIEKKMDQTRIEDMWIKAIAYKKR